eukprot:TRINITY_DN30055_c0_g1_i1.p1 TRINITY_DN30055_c0_g1~~TRINITY_DN30055_c0_g1_i1.p1  ORF type:complete len:1329 (+),score=451.80 TRINITY_DN30055_c0_g1_i1:205-4191(+)
MMGEQDDHAQPFIVGDGEGGAKEASNNREYDIGNHNAERYAKNSKTFCTNGVVTSKYSFRPTNRNFFLTKNIYHQLHRYSNVYFLLISILQQIPGISPTGQFTTLLPLCLVMFVSLLKDTIEDLSRHRRDKSSNAQLASVFRKSGWEKVMWRDVCVGDFVKVEKECEFPADLVLLWSESEKGMCHIETSNLDGETNLKLREAHVEPAEWPLGGFDPAHPGKYEGTLHCKHPDDDMYSFGGYLDRVDGEMRKYRASISVDSILLRGARLGGGTPSVIGVVVYTGRETKLMKNQRDAVRKLSQLEKRTNTQILGVLACEILLCVVCGILRGVAVHKHGSSQPWYLGYSDINPTAEGTSAILTLFILFNNLVPISLYITIEMVRYMQKFMIEWDVEMFFDVEDAASASGAEGAGDGRQTHGAMVHSSSLNEELGQVQYIFTDKTGTLTCNVMDFLKFSVSRQRYGQGTTEIGRAAAARAEQKLNRVIPAEWTEPEFQGQRKKFPFFDPKIYDEAGNCMWLRQENCADLAEFFKILAVCHTVVTEISKDGSLKYQAQSPDEKCLVTGVRHLGVEFIGRNGDELTLRIHKFNKTEETVEEKWTLLNTLEFDSDRKRMSVIVRDPQGKLKLFCKGADTVFFEAGEGGGSKRLRGNPSAYERSVRERSREYLNQFAAEGLRTLVVAKADLDEKRYAEWAPKYKKATENIGSRDRLIAEAAEEMEKDLVLVGTTAIEDKLQKGVPATISLLRAAGIKLWVLTGDKQETAINIGFACALLNNDMGVFKFADSGPQAVTEGNIGVTLRNYARDADSVRRDYGQELAMVVQGQPTLQLIANDAETCEKYFLDIARHCSVVICCRVTPGQKARVVKMVKQRVGQYATTLAIGDGANDVSMIKEAHVGIGISGLEGLQAANSADYAIAQFRYLQRLLLVHGRWNYRRNSKVIIYSFYKNTCLYLTQAWYLMYNQVTAQPLYDSWSMSMYNVLFASFPILALGIFDRDVEPKRLVGDDKSPGLKQFPELYMIGRDGRLFNTRVFWKYTLNAVFHSCVCFYIPAFGTFLMSDPDTGRELDMTAHGLAGYTACMFVVTVKCGLEVMSWTVINISVTLLSLGLWFFFVWFYGDLIAGSEGGSPPVWSKVFGHFKLPLLWLVVVLTVTLALLRDVLWKCYKHNIEPNLVHIIRQWENKIANQSRVTFSEGERDFDRNTLKKERPKLFPREMVKKYKKKTQARQDDAPEEHPAVDKMCHDDWFQQLEMIAHDAGEDQGKKEDAHNGWNPPVVNGNGYGTPAQPRTSLIPGAGPPSSNPLLHGCSPLNMNRKQTFTVPSRGMMSRDDL